VDLFARRIFPGELVVESGRIAAINELQEAPAQLIMPGFVDAHIHIESSMLVPTAFAQLAVVHGTVATVSDPHEIANVCGIPGVEYMIANSKKAGLKIFFGAPSCVPATGFETAGATLDATDVRKLLESPDIWYLSEMMNFPGVLHHDAEVMAKIAAAHELHKPVDGHAPGLRGDAARAYAQAGITTDHECFTLEEALEKIDHGMRILIREGSAARNYEALCPLLATHPAHIMFCSDDKHPDELMLFHINDLVKRSLSKGYDVFDVLSAASKNAVLHYKLPVGLLRTGDPADFIVVDSLQHFDILATYINGNKVAEAGKTLLPWQDVGIINQFRTGHRNTDELKLAALPETDKIRVIEAVEGQLITNKLITDATLKDGYVVSDTDRDILKMVVVNRYAPKEPVALAFIKHIGLKRGAIASSVGHDCHNIIAVGVDDVSLCEAINLLVDCKGGIAAVKEPGTSICLPLPVAGLMSHKPGAEVAEAYTRINGWVHDMGSTLHAPFMTLSFMALLVIPALKLSDKGLFDGNTFTFTPVQLS
jgi:adenine deaminase